jgi:hypothetical protein
MKDIQESSARNGPNSLPLHIRHCPVEIAGRKCRTRASSGKQQMNDQYPRFDYKITQLKAQLMSLLAISKVKLKRGISSTSKKTG